MAKRRTTRSTRKQPLGEAPESRPRASRGRTGPAETPVEVRAPGLTLDERVRPFVRAKLGAKLATFAEHMERVAVTFRDLNGPRGGEDIECRLRVVLVGRPEVVVRESSTNVQRAFERALRRLVEAVKRDLERAGYSANRSTRSTRAAPSPAEVPEADEPDEPEERPARPPRRSTTKANPSARSGENLAKRARARTHTPKAHAEASKVHRMGK